MDPRVWPSKALGAWADDWYVLRNGGGRITNDVLRSLVICAEFMNVSDVGVIHHTDCRLHNLGEKKLVLDSGTAIDLMSFTDPVASVIEDVDRLHSSAVLRPGTSVWGGLYRVETHTIDYLVGAPGGDRNAP
jgi:carbonic anhydrase